MHMRLLLICLVLALSACVTTQVPPSQIPSSQDTSFRWVPAHVAAPAALLQVPLERGSELPIWWMPHDAALATLVLFPGGHGVLGYDAMANAPLSPNFLIRSRELFHKAGFNVAIVGKARDRTELGLASRKSAEHSRDIRAALLRLKELAPKDLWLVGTSNGTVSVANAAIANADLVVGLVLTSSITKNENNVQSLKLGNIRVPTLVLHHSRDGCRICPPGNARDILSGLNNAPRKELIFISGGSGASGDPCQPMHYHGFINQEEETVVRIASWIRDTY